MCMNTFTPICIYRYKFAAEKKILVACVVGQTAGCTTLHEPTAAYPFDIMHGANNNIHVILAETGIPSTIFMYRTTHRQSISMSIMTVLIEKLIYVYLYHKQRVLA